MTWKHFAAGFAFSLLEIWIAWVHLFHVLVKGWNLQPNTFFDMVHWPFWAALIPGSFLDELGIGDDYGFHFASALIGLLGFLLGYSSVSVLRNRPAPKAFKVLFFFAVLTLVTNLAVIFEVILEGGSIFDEVDDILPVGLLWSAIWTVASFPVVYLCSRNTRTNLD
jgi:hypothetical protein